MTPTKVIDVNRKTRTFFYFATVLYNLFWFSYMRKNISNTCAYEYSKMEMNRKKNVMNYRLLTLKPNQNPISIVQQHTSMYVFVYK